MSSLDVEALLDSTANAAPAEQNGNDRSRESDDRHKAERNGRRERERTRDLSRDRDRDRKRRDRSRDRRDDGRGSATPRSDHGSAHGSHKSRRRSRSEKMMITGTHVVTETRQTEIETVIITEEADVGRALGLQIGTTVPAASVVIVMT